MGVAPLSPLADAALGLYRALQGGNLRLACAESCTGGMVCSSITDIPGSSEVLWGGVVAYSNECKTRLLGVPAATLGEFGAVSREVARAMASGACAAIEEPSCGRLALAITGIAGPGGGSAEKPVGLVWFAFRRQRNSADGGEAFEECSVFSGDRKVIRESAAEHAMLRATDLAMGRY